MHYSLLLRRQTPCLRIPCLLRGGRGGKSGDWVAEMQYARYAVVADPLMYDVLVKSLHQGNVIRSGAPVPLVAHVSCYHVGVMSGPEEVK